MVKNLSLAKNKAINEEYNWPEEPDEFVRNISQNYAAGKLWQLVHDLFENNTWVVTESPSVISDKDVGFFKSAVSDTPQTNLIPPNKGLRSSGQ